MTPQSQQPLATPAVQTLPASVCTLADHHAQARAVLDAATWAYVNGSAGDAITQHANRNAWDCLALLPRVLKPLVGGTLQTELLGRPLPTPLLVAPMALQRAVHADGELATALAASVQGVGLVVSTQASVAPEAIAQAVRSDAQRGPLWFQLYVQPERAATEALVRRAEAAGYEALVLTVDAPVQGARDAQRQAGFRVAAGAAASHLPPAHASGDAAAVLACAPTWDDVAWLRQISRLPLLLKGVLHPDDARQALELGVSGLIVSNHGGRTLDTAVATAWALPRIADAVEGRLPLLVDGGIRRGTDVLKALALGAQAVLVGRPVLWGLAHSGAVGVAHVLRLLRDECQMALALCGCRNVADVSPALLAPGGLARLPALPGAAADFAWTASDEINSHQ